MENEPRILARLDTLADKVDALGNSLARVETQVNMLPSVDALDERMRKHEIRDAATHTAMDQRIAMIWKIGGGLLAGAWALALAVLGKVWHAGG